MAQLAIQGHATRGNEVIALLKILGGVNKHNYTADCESLYFYVDGRTNVIYYDWCNCPKTNKILFTLEDFLAKFPYRVGDRVMVTDCISPYTISDMIWEDDEIKYRINCEDDWLTADELLPYTETDNLINTLKETQQVVREGNENLGKVIEKLKRKDMLDVFGTISKVEEKISAINFHYSQFDDKVQLLLGKDFEIIQEDGKTFVVRKQPQYPKTYEECCDVLIPDCVEFNVILNGYNGELLEKLGQLLICRDAYWKIAGDWQPNWDDEEQCKFVIYRFRDSILKDSTYINPSILAFPTAEMRDIFYDNFKDLIESCKELL